jgi:hypothetical protein
MLLRSSERAKRWKQKQAAQRGEGKALAILAARLGRAEDDAQLGVPSMRPLVSSASCVFVFPCWFARTEHVGPARGHFLGSVFSHVLVERCSSRFRLAAPLAGRRLAFGDGRRRPSIRVGLRAEAPESVFAHWRSVEAWYRDDPSLLRWRLAHTRNYVRSPGPVFNATKPSFHSDYS